MDAILATGTWKVSRHQVEFVVPEDKKSSHQKVPYFIKKLLVYPSWHRNGYFSFPKAHISSTPFGKSLDDWYIDRELDGLILCKVKYIPFLFIIYTWDDWDIEGLYSESLSN